MHLADAFIQSDLQCIQGVHVLFIFFISMYVPWELNPQPFALLTQCSTAEPQEKLCNIYIYMYTRGVATGVPGCAGATHSGSWHT